MHNPERFKSDLINWFEINQRQMPWRETSNPYYIWVSEVMLQQTQVNTVRSYYLKFIERFPTIEDLANASDDEVLKYWEGLGYYSRARNFHTAAKEVVQNYGGQVPVQPEVFKTLKGVGPYTQAAVMSIAFNHPLPTVDGNVFRVWSRLNNDDSDIALQMTRTKFEAALRPYVETEAGTFNQAMMELGALICTPKNPLCLFCPVQTHCESYGKGTVLDLPVKTKKVKRKTETYNVYLIENEHQEYVIEQITANLLTHMWEFPKHPSATSLDELKAIYGDTFEVNHEKIDTMKQQFTHVTWVLEVYRASVDLEKFNLPNENSAWLSPKNRDQFTLPASMNKIYEKYCKRNGN